MGGISVVDLIAVAPIFVGAVLWLFLPPERLRSTREKRANRHTGGDSDPRGELHAFDFDRSTIPWSEPWMSPSVRPTAKRENSARRDRPAAFIHMKPPARANHRVGPACSLAPHVLQR
jgi:hypothetical protein